jgi:hypothetical protein
VLQRGLVDSFEEARAKDAVDFHTSSCARGAAAGAGVAAPMMA